MEIKAFKAFRFDPAVAGDVGKCISPPYDVIDADMQQNLYDRSQYNVVRVIKGKTTAADTDEDNQYTRAGKYLRTWIETGALKADLRETIYAYVQDFEVGSEHFRRSGFISLGRLEEFGPGVRAHEKTLNGPKADRLKLMTHKAAQLGQIFMLYDDSAKIADAVIARVVAREPLVEFTDDDGVRHSLFAIDDEGDIFEIAAMMSGKQAVIADGHHRYETALNYYAETQNPAAQYRMMTFVNMRNKGLIILPTHRLVASLPGFDIKDTIERIKSSFDVSEYPFANDGDKARAQRKMFDRMKSCYDNGKNAFGLYAASNVFYSIVLKDSGAMDAVTAEMSSAARGLDVNILHKLILENVLGIGDKQLAGQSNLEYIKDIGDAIDKSIAAVDTGRSQAIFFMNPTRIEQVKAIAAAGEKMPQKSTFFYPKIFTGLVVNKL